MHGGGKEDGLDGYLWRVGEESYAGLRERTLDPCGDAVDEAQFSGSFVMSQLPDGDYRRVDCISLSGFRQSIACRDSDQTGIGLRSEPDVGVQEEGTSLRQGHVGPVQAIPLGSSRYRWRDNVAEFLCSSNHGADEALSRIGRKWNNLGDRYTAAKDRDGSVLLFYAGDERGEVGLGLCDGHGGGTGGLGAEFGGGKHVGHLQMTYCSLLCR